jgi:ketosteroid isomerase-like protein
VFSVFAVCGDSAALDEFYHPGVKVWEMPTGELRHGREAQRDAIRTWENSIEKIHDAGHSSITADEENAVTMAETWIDFTTKEGQRLTMKEVSVQKWKDDRIVEEKFYYQTPTEKHSGDH